MQFGSQRWPKVATGNRKLFATNIRTSWHSFSSFLGNGKLSGVAGVKSEHKWKLWPINGIIEFPLDFFFLALKIPPTSHTYIFFGFYFVAAKLDDDWPKGVQFYILGKWEMPLSLPPPPFFLLYGWKVCWWKMVLRIDLLVESLRVWVWAGIKVINEFCTKVIKK